jgi:hypothetical protein
MAAMTIFERLGQGHSQPIPTTAAREDPTTILLEWLVKRWTHPKVTARDIHRSAPRAVRDKRTILSSTDTLVTAGWLVPTPTWRHDKREWKIVRGLPLK